MVSTIITAVATLITACGALPIAYKKLKIYFQKRKIIKLKNQVFELKAEKKYSSLKEKNEKEIKNEAEEASTEDIQDYFSK